MNRLDKLKIKHKGGNNMNREETAELIKVMQAYLDGKQIQYYKDGIWKDTSNPSWSSITVYRIKPEPKYRPFANAEECWQEMQKHQPFGWVKEKEIGDYEIITRVNDKENIGFMAINSQRDWTLEGLMDFYTFADGTPFGIKEE